jgi:Eco29kI restriction endonuclease
MINAYNPLDKVNLAKSIETELLTSAPSLLSDVGSLKGAGVYAIYYIGDFKPYVPIKLKNLNGLFSQPIYVGKAIPKGGRKGGLSIDLATSIMGRSLADRLGQHAQSIVETQNLKIEDFFVRYLVVDDIWIPLGETCLLKLLSQFGTGHWTALETKTLVGEERHNTDLPGMSCTLGDGSPRNWQKVHCHWTF